MLSILKRELRALFAKATRIQIDSYLTEISGVIHVGANTGQERNLYAKHGLRVLWIEPIPEVFNQLVSNIQDYENQSAIMALITDCDGKEYEFHISSNEGASSSVFDLNLHKDIWPSVEYVSTLKLKSVTLPALLRINQLDPKKYDALVLDTQGSELLILQGCSEILPNFKYIQMEAADFEAYKDCCQLRDINQYLNLKGFREWGRKKFATHPNKGSYYDIIYRKSKDN